MRARNGSGRTSGWQTFIKFAYAGLGVKRWILLWSVGVGIIAIGLAFVSKNVFDIYLPNFLPWYLEGVLLGGVGVAAVVVSIFGLYRSVGHLVLATSGIDSLADTLYTRRYRARGPRIVTIGGGTGMSVLLRGLKEHTDNISAIVTVGDDGGSSGRLRENFGVLPPGDFRNCLIALSDDETLVRDLFQYRFDRGEGLEGHSFGNLFIAAMTDITGNFEAALAEFSRVLAVHGRVIPATNESLHLSAKLFDGTVVDGESNIGSNGGVIREMMIRPHDAAAVPAAIEAILDAEVIVIGPGSLYTSILPNLLVRGIAEAVLNAEAQKLYICNVSTEHGETIGYTVADHMAALQEHTGRTIVNYVVANSGIAELGPPFKGRLVQHDGQGFDHATLVTADLIDPDFPVRHDSSKLADCILDVYHKKVPEAGLEVSPSA